MEYEHNGTAASSERPFAVSTLVWSSLCRNS